MYLLLLLSRRIIVGAPHSVETDTKERYGALYKCDTSKSENCTNMEVDSHGKHDKCVILFLVMTTLTTDTK